MVRSSWKTPFVSNKIFSMSIRFLKKSLKKPSYKIDYLNYNYNLEDKIMKPIVDGRERSSTITWHLTKFPMRIYNGIYFRKHKLHYYNIGLKLGSLTFNRRPYHFPLKRKKKR